MNKKALYTVFHSYTSIVGYFSISNANASEYYSTLSPLFKGTKEDCEKYIFEIRNNPNKNIWKRELIKYKFNTLNN